MKKRHRSPIAAMLFTTALLGLGALPALAGPPPSPLDNFANDILAQENTPGATFTLTVNPYPNGTVSGTPETDGGIPSNYYVGLTTGVLTETLSGQTSQSDPFYMFCVDFNHDISGLPVTYAINIESLFGNTIPDPNPPGLGLPMTTLQTQALLGENFGTTAPTGAQPQLQTDIDAQHEIWNLSYEGNGSAPFTPLNADMQQLLQNAQDSLASNTFADSYLFDIVNAPGGTPPPGQAFMPVTSGGFTNNDEPPPTPEPGTLAMLGLGLLGLGSLKLRRSQR